MPNWCENGLTITGDKGELDRFLENAAGETDGETGEFSLAKLYPPPVGADSQEWCVEHWGTKGDVNGVEGHRDADDEAFFQFDTAWTPPLAALRHISTLYPLLTFSLSYEEDGEAFAGDYAVQDGNVLRHEERDLADEDSDDEDNEDDED